MDVDGGMQGGRQDVGHRQGLPKEGAQGAEQQGRGKGDGDDEAAAAQQRGWLVPVYGPGEDVHVVGVCGGRF